MKPALFTKDWFDGRNIEANFTDSSKSIGWDSGLSNYSEFLFDESYLSRLLPDKELIIEELEKICTSMDVPAMVKFGRNVGTAYTDGFNIVIDNKYIPKLTDNKESIYHRLDILIGMLIHEACHCKYTDIDYCIKSRELLNAVIHSFYNVLEDECIERNIGLGFPGYANFIKALKKEVYDQEIKDEPIEWGSDKITDIFNLFLITIRYPEQLNDVPEFILERYSELFEKIHKILEFKGLLKCKENLLCTRSTVSAAIAICNLLNITEQKPEIKEKQDKLDDTSDEDKYDVGSKIFIDDAIGSLIESIINPFNSQNIDCKSEALNSEQENDILKEISFNNVEGTGKFGWEGGYGVNDNIKDMKKSGILEYNKLFGDIKYLIPYFREIIVPTNSDEQYKKIEFQRSGQLDPNQIITALQGGQFVNTKFQRNIIKRKPKYSLVLNLDESGSMFGDYVGRNIRIKKDSPYGIASRLAVLFYEAMKDYADLEIYIYGHGDNINRYIFPGKLTNKYVLGRRQMQGGQNDAKSIDAILTEVRANTNNPIIMVNITDSLYLSGIDDMTSITNKFGDVALTLMCVSQFSKKYLTPEHIETNNKLYGANGWVCIDDKTNLKKIAKELATIFRNKYKTRDK